MKSAFDVFQRVVYSWTLKYEDRAYVYHEIEASGPEFEKFLNWLKETPYDIKTETKEVGVKTEDESISW